MTAHEYLMQVSNLDKDIQKLRDDIKEINYTKLSVGSIRFDGQIGSRSKGIRKSARFEDLIAKSEALTIKLMKKQTESLYVRAKIFRTISQLEKKQFNVLYHRYFRGLKFIAIAYELGTSRSQVDILKNKAFTNLENLINS